MIDALFNVLSGALLGVIVGVLIGYGLGAASAQPATQPGAAYDADLRAESAALETDEAHKPSEAWIDKLEQEINKR